MKPGTPKFEKAFQNMVTTHLNARPKKVVPVEPKHAGARAPTAARGAVRK